MLVVDSKLRFGAGSLIDFCFAFVLGIECKVHRLLCFVNACFVFGVTQPIITEKQVIGEIKKAITLNEHTTYALTWMH